MMPTKAGQIVRFVDPTPDERAQRMLVLEVNGDRTLVRHICKLPIPPTQVVRTAELEVCETIKRPKRPKVKRMKLYYHKTDGGAEYLTDTFVEWEHEGKTGREGIFEGARYIVRIDGDITQDAELLIAEPR